VTGQPDDLAGSSLPTGEDSAAEAAASLDLLLTDASRGMLRRFLPNGSTVRFGLGLARKPATVTRRFRARAVRQGPPVR